MLKEWQTYHKSGSDEDKNDLYYLEPLPQWSKSYVRIVQQVTFAQLGDLLLR